MNDERNDALFDLGSEDFQGDYSFDDGLDCTYDESESYEPASMTVGGAYAF